MEGFLYKPKLCCIYIYIIYTQCVYISNQNNWVDRLDCRLKCWPLSGAGEIAAPVGKKDGSPWSMRHETHLIYMSNQSKQSKEHLLWMVTNSISHHEMKPWLKPYRFVGICVGESDHSRVLRRCEMDFVHPQYQPRLFYFLGRLTSASRTSSAYDRPHLPLRQTPAESAAENKKTTF